MLRIILRLRQLVVHRLATQEIARTNAAQASATLQKRRDDRDEVDGYLRARRLTHPGRGTESSL